MGEDTVHNKATVRRMFIPDNSRPAVVLDTRLEVVDFPTVEADTDPVCLGRLTLGKGAVEYVMFESSR